MAIKAASGACITEFSTTNIGLQFFETPNRNTTPEIFTLGEQFKKASKMFI